jgi:hypothetical protein
MDELEHRLQSQRLAAPSADLDRRIGEAFAIAHAVAEERRRPPLWWWLVPTAVAVSSAAMLLVALPRVRPPVATTVHRIEAEGRLREMLLNSVADSHSAPPAFVVRIDAP